MELLDVYDNNGNRTGRVVERGNKNEVFSDNEHIAVAIIFIENSKGEFLIQKTSKENKEYSSTGGHIDHNEDADSTIIREEKRNLELILLLMKLLNWDIDYLIFRLDFYII